MTYRSVALAILAVVAAFGVFMHFAFPTTSAKIEAKGEKTIKDYLDKWFGNPKPTAVISTQAHFTNLDGTVTVRKANSSVFVRASYETPLERGDVVKTEAEGMAKVVFADNSTYTIKQDSLVSIEATASGSEASTSGGVVEVKSGKVDLSTPVLPTGSSQEVVMAGSRTTVGSDSAMQAENNPRDDKHEVLVTKGENVKITVGTETTTIAPYERVKFNPETGAIAKEKELAPPTLIDPANMMPLFVLSPNAEIHFTWTPVQSARGYHVRISRNPYFSSTVLDKKVPSTDIRQANLGEGAFYWMVQSLDAKGKESVESEKNRFTVIPRSKEGENLVLELEPFIQFSHVIQLKGRTERGARVMVNGEEVPVVGEDGKFNYFTPPLPTGVNVITVTAQNTRGGVATKTQSVIIQ